MKLSVIICCYNERATIMDVIEATKSAEITPWEREIIIVDNCSTDGTRELLREIDDPEIRVIYHEQNMGKGMSIRTGISHMQGDYMLIQDADLEYDPAEHSKFCHYASKHNPPALFGSRILSGDIKTKYARTLFGNRLLTWLTNIMFQGNLTDVATATKMVRADVVQALHLTTTDFNLDFELPNKILLSGHDIHEIPISYNPRTYEEGKKIGTQDGIRAILTILRDRAGLTPVFKEEPAHETQIPTLH